MILQDKYVFIIALTLSLSGCADANENITLEQCGSHKEEFKKYLEEKVSPIINISETKILNLPEMIDFTLIKELKRYSNIFDICNRKQIYEEKGKERKYDYSIIGRDLFSMTMFMGNIKEQSSSGPEMLSVLADSMKKNYVEIKNELE